MIFFKVVNEKQSRFAGFEQKSMNAGRMDGMDNTKFNLAVQQHQQDIFTGLFHLRSDISKSDKPFKSSRHVDLNSWPHYEKASV